MVANDDQLGVVLGHEMAHTVLGHGVSTLPSKPMLLGVHCFPKDVDWNSSDSLVSLGFCSFSVCGYIRKVHESCF